MNDTNPEFKWRGLEQTPRWRWLIYGLLFIGAVAYLGLKFDRALLIAAPIGGAFIIAMFFGMDRFIKNPRGRAWLLRNLGLLILIFIVGRIALFVWDSIEDRKYQSPSNKTPEHISEGRGRPSENAQR